MQSETWHRAAFYQCESDVVFECFQEPCAFATFSSVGRCLLQLEHRDTEALNQQLWDIILLLTGMRMVSSCSGFPVSWCCDWNSWGNKPLRTAAIKVLNKGSLKCALICPRDTRCLQCLLNPVFTFSPHRLPCKSQLHPIFSVALHPFSEKWKFACQPKLMHMLLSDQ